MQHYVRCPGSFLGMRPFTLYTAVGHDVTVRLGLDSDVYIHHVNMDKSHTILVTDQHCLAVVHNKSRSVVKMGWRIKIKNIHNLPLIENDHLVVHLYENISSEPLLIQCDNHEKLKSIQLALEYAVLLTMPYTSSIYTKSK